MAHECTEHKQTFDKAEDLVAHLREEDHAEVNVSAPCRCGQDTTNTYRGKMPDGVSNVLVLCDGCLEAECAARGWTVTKPAPPTEEEEEDDAPSSE